MRFTSLVVAIIVSVGQAMAQGVDVTPSKPETGEKTLLDILWPALPPYPDLSQNRAWVQPVAGPYVEPLGHDPVREVLTSRWRGLLVYGPRILRRERGGASRSLVLRGIGVTGLADGHQTPMARYGVPGAGSGALLPPTFSPNSRYILYADGELGSEYAQNEYYMWDMQGRTVRRVTGEISTAYPLVLWSPDSRYVFFVTNSLSEMSRFEAADEQYPPTLYTYDRVEDKNHAVATHLSLRNPVALEEQAVAPIAWTPDNKLLFTKLLPAQELTEEQIVAEQRLPPALRTPRAWPALYEVSPQGGPVQQVLPQAYYPVPSPDGQWIAHFGWYQEEHAMPGSGAQVKHRAWRPGILLFHRGDKRQMVVRPLPVRTQRSHPSRTMQMRWTPDSKRLVLVEFEMPTPARPIVGRNNPATTTNPVRDDLLQMTVSLLEMPPRLAPLSVGQELLQINPDAIQQVATIRAEGFQLHQVSRNGQHLFLDINEGAVQEGEVADATRVRSLQALSLTDGTLSLIARFHNNSLGYADGWDWHELAPTEVLSIKDRN